MILVPVYFEANFYIKTVKDYGKEALLIQRESRGTLVKEIDGKLIL
jgi:hypothetical protein